MRRSEASLAVIRHRADREPARLALWNPKWGAFHLAGGHRDPDESPLDCVIRELDEELGLRPEGGGIIALAPLGRVEYEAWSVSARAVTAYRMDLFDVELSGEAERDLVGNPSARWLDRDEIRSGRCRDGRPVSPTMGFLLAEVGRL